MNGFEESTEREAIDILVGASWFVARRTRLALARRARAVELDGEAKLSAIEVDDESSDRLLTAEFQPEAATIAEELPSASLRGRLRSTQAPSQLALGGADMGRAK